MPKQSDEANEAFLDAVLDAAGYEAEQPAQSNSPQNDKGRHYEPFNMPAFLTRHGLWAKEIKQDAQYGTKYILKECPFDPSHRAPDSYVAVLPSGALCFKCSHNSCASFKWRDLRERLEPGYQNKPSNGNLASLKIGDKPSDEITYRRITAAELDAGDYRIEWLIEGTLVAGQPLVVAGGKKCLKTNTLVDAAVSLATATPMFGQLQVYRDCRVALMSGESGLATLQETARRICRARGLDLRDITGLIISPDLPRFADIRHLDALERFILADEIEALMIDPAYLCMDMDGREGSLFASGPLLKALSGVCEKNGVTLALCHHTRKGLVDPFAPPELEDIAWAGFQEFARQWWLLGRRERFDPDSDGEHKLWLNIGGSAGFASLWAVDITEGKYPAPRRWEVTLSHAAEAREEAVQKVQAAKAEEKGKKHNAKVETAKARIADSLRSVDGNQDTKRNIRERAGMKGAAFDEAFAYLLRVGTLTEVEIERTNGRKYEGFKYDFTK